MKKILSILSVLALVWVVTNNAVNWHYHRLSCGQIIQHAHPYDRDACCEEEQGTVPFGKSGENHKHSESEMLALFMSSSISLVVITIASLLVIFRHLISKIAPCYIRQVYSRSHYNIASLRAPPYC